MDDLATQYGQNDIRATTRQCFQIHGILKGDLKTVIAALMNIGSSTVGVRCVARRCPPLCVSVGVGLFDGGYRV